MSQKAQETEKRLKLTLAFAKRRLGCYDVLEWSLCVRHKANLAQCFCWGVLNFCNWEPRKLGSRRNN